MKRTIFIMLSFFIFQSCEKDDTALECQADCTTVQGQLVTAKGEPLPNIPVAFNYQYILGIGSKVRRIKKITTDKNGNYKMQFFVKDEELTGDAGGYFELVIDYSNLDSEVYISTDSYYSLAVGQISNRDTTITLDFYNPKKAYITVNLNGFNPSTEDDYFEIRSLYPTGLKIGENEFINSEYQLGYDGNESSATSFNTKVDSLLVAKSDFNLISISKRKNGGEDIDEYHEIFVPENSKEEYNYDY